jgi:hypothetical protein
MSFPACFAAVSFSLVLPLALALAPQPAPSNRDGPATIDEAMTALQGRYKTAEKKYEGLAKKIEQAAGEAIRSAEWRPAGEGAAARPLAQHPRLAWLAALAATVGSVKRPSDAAAELLELFPWREMLELTDGVQYGSDRPIPENQNGFIVLGAANAPCAGFPELSVNTYLWGLGEVVGWRFRVDDKKSPRFQGRGPKDAPEAQRELPGWERVRVALYGVQSDTALYALPALTHAIHARGVERRRGADGKLHALDRFAAFLDSRWNGYIVALPYLKEPLAIVSPIHACVADRKGFLFRFPKSEEMGKVGDLPFISITTQRDYGQHLLDLSVTAGDLISNTPDATRLIERFWEDCGYLSRYKLVVDGIARAVLTPNVPYPQYLADFDFKGGKLPAADAPEAEFDVPRAHALLVWAWAGGDPAKVADFLHDEVVAVDGNRFPSKAALQIVFATRVRERQGELLKAIGERVEAERAARAQGSGPGDLELELSPFPELGASGTPALSHLVRRYHAFHEPLSRATSEAAWELVRAEL